jgi:hypothetical protein
MLEINKIFTPGLPWETYPEANIATAPATDLKAWHDGSIIPTLVGMGQPDVKFMSISFYNDGFVGMADIQINGITLTAMDDTSAAIPVHSALEKVYVKNQAGDITYDIADVSTDLLATSFYMNIGTPLLVPAAVTRTVYISADIPLDAVQRRMKLRFAVQGDCDRNSVPSGYVTFTASNSDTFPMDSGVTTITAIAYNFKVGHKDLMPVSAAAGQPGVRAMEIDFSSDNIIPIRVTAVALVVKDAGNSVIPASGVISRFIILDETGTTIGAGATGATGYVCVTLTPVQVSAGTIRNITGLLDIANNAGGSFYIELEKSTSVNTLPLSSVNPMNGDAFGSMRTKAVSIKGTGLESTFHFFPNPFCPVKEQCHIEYYLPQQREVTIKIYTMDGRLVRVPADKLAKDSGLHYEDVWDGRNGAGEKVSSGVYLCILKAIDKATGKETKLIEKIMAVR